MGIQDSRYGLPIETLCRVPPGSRREPSYGRFRRGGLRCPCRLRTRVYRLAGSIPCKLGASFQFITYLFFSSFFESNMEMRYRNIILLCVVFYVNLLESFSELFSMFFV